MAALVVTAGQEGGGVGGETDHSDTQPRGLDKGAKFGSSLEQNMVFAIQTTYYISGGRCY